MSKASNAIVSIVDYYSTTIAELATQLQAKDEVIRRLGDQLKSVSPPTSPDPRLVEAALTWEVERLRTVVRAAVQFCNLPRDWTNCRPEALNLISAVDKYTREDNEGSDASD